jgi:hypothetical protein
LVKSMAKQDALTWFPLRHIGLGLAIRELLAPWTGHPYDFEIWTRLGFYMQNLGNPYRTLPYVPGLSFSPFSVTGSIGYPPLSAFIFALTYRLYALLGEPSRFLYYFLLKQPIVLADIGAALVLAKIILLSGDARSARTALLVWLYFPLGIIISSMWGQLDPISLFLSLLSIYFFLSSKWLPSAAMLGLAIYLKTLPIVFLPVFLMLARTSRKTRLGYSVISLIIPVAGTLVPAQVFNWGYLGVYNNISFQVALPLSGAMSVLGLVYLASPIPSIGHYLIGSIWIPVLLATYFYIWKRNIPLVHGLIITILAFSMSRPFLTEQYSIYPLAFLLLVQTRENVGHFLGLAASATAFLIVNNTLLVIFFTPISTSAFNWGIFIISQSPYATLRAAVLSLLALLYFTESFLVIRGRESIVYRAIMATTPHWLLQKQRVSHYEVGIVESQG